MKPFGWKTHRLRDAVALLLLAPVFVNYATAADEPKARSDVRDQAGMFSAAAVAKANESLTRIERDYRLQVVVETIESLGGETIDQASLKRAKRAISDGLFVLISMRDHKLEVVASPKFREAFPLSVRVELRKAFSTGFGEAEFDRGLTRGIQSLSEHLARLKDDGKLPTASSSAPAFAPPPPARESERFTALSSPGGGADTGVPAGESPLVLKDQYRLTLAGARKIVAASEAKAAEMKLKVNIAVVDDGGHLIAFARMDGARPASSYTATTKAVTAATFRAPTGPLSAGSKEADPLLNLSLQNAAAASGGKLTTLYGGIPVVVAGQVIGGVGVGGGSGEQDAQVSRAGVDAFLKEIQQPPPAKPQAEKGDASEKPQAEKGDASERKEENR